MKTLSRTAAALLLLLGTSAGAQPAAGKPAITIFPFGTTRTAAAVSTDLAAPKVVNGPA